MVEAAEFEGVVLPVGPEPDLVLAVLPLEDDVLELGDHGDVHRVVQGLLLLPGGDALHPLHDLGQLLLDDVEYPPEDVFQFGAVDLLFQLGRVIRDLLAAFLDASEVDVWGL